ncbi:hypothetical protein LAUMK41_05875 [Mycobacterium attenuatum]|nr:hypothetical protein LAUMK41_05875 [Mycobacterium attenuatum]
MQTVEQWPSRGQFGDVRVELVEVDVQMADGLVGKGHDAGLVALAGKQDVAGLGQAEIARGQAGDLAHASRGVVEQNEQHPVPASFRCLPGERGKDRPGLSFGEVLDGPAGPRRRFEGLGCLAERDEREIFVGRVGQERLDGAEAQRDGLGRVVPLIGHPSQPSLQVWTVEVIEADVLTSDVLSLSEVVQEALQADPICLNRFR